VKPAFCRSNALQHDPQGFAAFRAAEQIIQRFDLPNTWHTTETLVDIILSATEPPPEPGVPAGADALKHNCATEAACRLMQALDDDDHLPVARLFAQTVRIISGAIAEFHRRANYDAPHPSRN
jgi:hypothetical protein